MNDRPMGLWIVLLVAVAGMLHVVPAVPGNGLETTPPSRENAQKRDSTDLADQCTGTGLVSQFWRANHVQDHVSGLSKVSDALIVTIADPVDSHIAFNFDER